MSNYLEFLATSLEPIFGSLDGSTGIVLLILVFSIFLLVEIYRDVKKNARYSDYQLDSVISEQEKISEEDKFSWVNAINKVFSTNPKEVGDKLLAAGFYHPKLAQWFITAKYSLLFIGLVSTIVASTYLHFKVTNTVVLVAFWLIAVIILPDSYLEVVPNFRT